MPNSSSPPSAAAPASLIDSRQAAWRLLTTLGLVVLGNSSMYVVSVVLPAVQAEFGVGRADASLPYTLMMVCLGLGGIWTGRMADRHGLMPVLCVGAVAVCGGFVWAGLSGSIWGFGLAHGLMGLIGSSATFAPLMADTALWWNKRRGIAVAVCASGNYIAGALWPPIVQHGIELIGWRHTYVLLGIVCGVGMLLLGGMPLFDSLVHAFGTVGTGGFGIRADSIASYSPYIQGVITVFMILCGINFNLYYLLLLRQWRSVLRSDELWTYLGLVVVATGVITLDLRGVYGGLDTCLRQAAFQVGSVITTTGYATADFNVWPGLSRAILFALMFIGGCAGSTAGGLKVSRAMILLRTIRREINRLVHPRRVTAVRCDGKALGSEVQRGVSIYFALYCLCILVAFLCLSGEPFTLETNLSAVVSCFNNVGPGLGAVGPAGSYADYSVLSKLLLSMAMLMGRLEIYPMLVALSPSVWRKD